MPFIVLIYFLGIQYRTAKCIIPGDQGVTLTTSECIKGTQSLPMTVRKCINYCPLSVITQRFFKMYKLENRNNIQITIPTAGPPLSETDAATVGNPSSCFPNDGECGLGLVYQAMACTRYNGIPLPLTSCNVTTPLKTNSCTTKVIHCRLSVPKFDFLRDWIKKNSPRSSKNLVS